MKRKTKNIIGSFATAMLLLSVISSSTVSAKDNNVEANLVTQGIEFKMLDRSKLPTPILTSEQEKREHLDNLSRQAHEIWLKEKDMTAVNDFYRENNCIVLTPDKNEALGEVASTNSDVSMPLPSVVYEMYSGHYIINASMQWNKTGTTPKWYSDHIAGGAGDAEVVGIGIGNGKETAFKNKGYLLFIEDKNDSTDSINVAMDWGNSGVIWRPQDAFSGSTTLGTANYNIDGYFGSLYVEYVGGNTQPLKIYHTYAHTWKTTGISGFSFETTGISISLSNNTYGWKTISGPKYW
ncbi:hypothetical protein [Paenibacillus sp. NPDC058174]|uniref:hypothetical protein n=1 Tax=Paenibacillus sp. NPDC058174 TaxID=3346366 RepID=UPI0036DDA0F1